MLAPEDLVDDWDDLSTSDLAPGTRLGRYELLVPVAYGGMARVWAARQHGQRGFSKIVAIKTILPHLAREPEFERMFLDEARIASGVHHPNVCEIYELGEEGHCLYLAMEWVNGESLVHILRPNRKTTIPIDMRVAARICADACAGIHAAHNLGDDDGHPLNVVHRDVSPHNILVAIEGNVKVTDFGVAKAYGQMHQATVAGQIKGKVAYMAPEQITGAPIDRRSDIYSVGCVLYEATTGAQPFRGDNDPQVMQAVIRGEYVPPSRVVNGYPAQLEQIIFRALQPDPANRFPTAESMRLALEDWIVRSGPIMAPSQVATVVRQRCGVEIEKRRERLRSAVDASQASADASGGYAPPPVEHTPSQQGVKLQLPGSHSGVKPAALSPHAMRPRMSSQPEPSVVVGDVAGGHSPMAPPVMPSPFAQSSPQQPGPPPNALRAPITISTERSIGGGGGGRVLVAALIGGGFAVVLLVAGLVVWRMSPASVTAPTAVASSVASPPRASASAIASAAPSASAVAAPAPVAEITFKIVPDDAILIVDGKELAPGARTIPRPAPGAVVSVVVRAAGHHDEPLRIDDGVPAIVDIWLQPNVAPKPGAGGPGPGVGAAGGQGQPSGPVVPQRGGPAPLPPPNPF